MLEGLRNQDMQLAGGILMLLATLTVIGTLISDLLLAVLDPRIRITE
jgi:peptide/nickel transport system permease protein